MTSAWLVNGERIGVDPRDRGLAYGDGLFETMAWRAGRIRFIERHLDRLLLGCGRLAIAAPDRALLREEIERVAADFGPGPGESAVVKVILTRGVGPRGYRPPEPAEPTRIVTMVPWSPPPTAHYTDGIELRTCALRLGENPQLAGLKHLCRLEQVLAEMELTGTNAHEGLLRADSGFVVGGISTNLFAVHGRRLSTPRVDRCGVDGVMRRVVLERAREAGLEPVETELGMDDVLAADELLVTNAVAGIKPVRRLDGHAFRVGPKAHELSAVVEREGDA